MALVRKILPMLNALPVFEEAARLRSFTQAAKTLGMAQPSVSRFISNLEGHLSVELFDRCHNKVSLTPKGEQLFEATKLGLGHIRMAIENFDAPVTDNILTILCSQGFAHLWFLPRRSSLLAHLEGYEIHLATTDTLADHVPCDSDIEILFGRGDWKGKGIALAWDGLTVSHLSNNWLVALDGLNIRTGQGYYLVFSPTNPVAQGLRNWAAEVGQID